MPVKYDEGHQLHLQQSTNDAQIISLKQQKGMRKLTKLLSDPSNVIEKKVLYAALVRQRKVLFDNKILSSTDDIINQQIEEGLLTRHLFPFSSMTLTKEGDILVKWEPQHQ